MSDLPNSEIRQFLVEAFSDDELRNLCFDYFPEVHDDFTAGMTKNQMVLSLIGYCQRRLLVPNLLAAIQKARPDQYQQRFLQAPQMKIYPEPGVPVRNPRQVFISHAHEDAEFAQRLAHDLQHQGWPIWIAPDQIQPGEIWGEAIDRGLAESGVFVLVLTPRAVVSRYVRKETYAAIDLESQGALKFIPLDLESCHVPPLWKAHQQISFQGRYADGLASLLRELARQTSGPSQAQKVEEDSSKSERLTTKPIVPLNPDEQLQARLERIQTLLLFPERAQQDRIRWTYEGQDFSNGVCPLRKSLKYGEDYVVEWAEFRVLDAHLLVSRHKSDQGPTSYNGETSESSCDQIHIPQEAWGKVAARIKPDSSAEEVQLKAHREYWETLYEDGYGKVASGSWDDSGEVEVKLELKLDQQAQVIQAKFYMRTSASQAWTDYMFVSGVYEAAAPL